MNSNHVAGLVLATAFWVGLGAFAILGGSTPPLGEIWTSTSSEKVASHPMLVRASYPATPSARAAAGGAIIAAR
jgi:hypothetical protein